MTEPLLTTWGRRHDQAVAVFDMLLSVLEGANPCFIGHSMRVAEMAANTAAAMGLPEPQIAQIRLAARLHDLGMVAVPGAVLMKASPLTPEETMLIRLHPQIGAQLIAPIVPPAIQAMVRGHHERWNGTGYPDRIGGTAIPVGARILAAAEIFDALTSVRAYRASLTDDEALGRLQELAGTGLDPLVVEAVGTALGQSHRLTFIADQHPARAEVDPTVWPTETRPRGDLGGWIG